ncbi:hypothetical protein [Nocardia neocaledoniensis]|uniref:hypothetical protein n=1 Tax=Nocardia neocaledoniensis TaxID=236511 RepID=UPI00245893F3|nr:hypothetical protein [Nocardia neocaledoniensis]
MIVMCGTAVRWVSGDSTAGGVIEVQFSDATGVVHSIVDKVPVFCGPESRGFHPGSVYPAPCPVEVVIVEQLVGRTVVDLRWSLSTAEERRFVVPAAAIPAPRAWRSDFHVLPWDEVAATCRRMSDRYPEFRHVTDVVDSVLRSGCDHLLVGSVSMHDVLVAARPVVIGAIEEVVVRAPSSLVPVADGTVVIDCLSDVHPDRLVAPVHEAVPLFWRCVGNVLGVTPGHQPW